MPRRSASRRGAEAAARVAERFAHAPSYSEMLAEETQTCSSALAQHAAEQPMLAGFSSAEGRKLQDTALVSNEMQDAASVPVWETVPGPQALSAAPLEQMAVAEPIPIRQAGETPAEYVLAFSETEPVAFEVGAAVQSETATEDAMEAVEPAQPLNTNLIEFPRELVATRKIRPRLAEGPYAAAHSAQLSIFEVDPGTISTEPVAETVTAAPAWSEPEWSGLELDADPAENLILEEAAPVGAAPVAPVIDRAPMNRRMLALVVDGALISAALIGAVAAFAANLASLPGPRELAIGAGAAFLAISALYAVLFFTLARATPGMKYACLQLATFGGERPTRAHRCRRLAAMAISVLPLGLGLAWSLFDDERLCWHDRLSQTYLKSSF